MKTAYEMIRWYTQHRKSHRWKTTDMFSERLFKVAEKNLEEDEEAILSFIGTLDEKGSYFYPFWKFWGDVYGFVLTNKGILVTNIKGVILKKVSCKTIKLDYLNDLSKEDRIFLSTINIDTIKETINCTLRKSDAQIVYPFLRKEIVDKPEDPIEELEEKPKDPKDIKEFKDFGNLLD